MTSSRQVAAAAVLEIIVVVIIGVTTHHDGALSLLAAIVVAPLAIFFVWKLGTRLAGPRLGGAAAVVYIALPVLSRAYFLTSYRHTFVHASLPQLVGLEAPQSLAFGVLCVAFMAYAPRRLLGLAGFLALVSGLAIWGIGPLGDIRTGLHETAWSIAFIEWLVVASVIGAARRSPSLAVALAGTLSFFVLRGAHGGYDGGAFWRSLAPVMPVAAVLLTSLSLLVPRLRPVPSPTPAP
jgi:hypothetical protein